MNPHPNPDLALYLNPPKRNARKVITPAMMAKIRALASTGEIEYRVIAQRFSLSAHTVTMIVRRNPPYDGDGR